MKVKVSGVKSYRDIKIVDKKVDYITIPVGGTGTESVPLGTARELASIVSSTPVLGIRRSTITWAVDTARKMDFGIIEYMIPVPSVSAAILAEMLGEYGVKLGTVIVWDKKWIPEKPKHYINSLLTLAPNIEYVIIDPKSRDPPLEELDMKYANYGIKYGIVNNSECNKLIKYNINIIDINIDIFSSVIDKVRKGDLNECYAK